MLTTFLAAALFAQSAPRLGDKGQLATSVGLGLTAAMNVYSPGDEQTYALSLSPGLDYFVLPRLSIGGALGLSYASNQSRALRADSYGVSVVPRIGYVVPLGERLSFWPRLSFSAAYNAGLDKQASKAALASNSFAVATTLNMPVLLEVGPLFFGLGPYATFTSTVQHNAVVAGPAPAFDSRRLTFGLSSQFGGYF